MKKLLAILLTCVLTMGVIVIPVCADSIYYPCYEGVWTNTDTSNTVNLEIYNVTNSDMSLYFQYGQFAVYVNKAEINSTKVTGNYYEEWEDGDFVVSGTITLDLGDKGIWLDWHSYENGRDCGVKGFMMKNSNFSCQAIQESSIKVVLDGNPISFDQNPVMINDRVMVPVRAIAEAMGAEVSWDEVRKIGRVVGITKDNRYIGFSVDDTGYNEYYNPFNMMIRDGDEDGRFIALDAPVIIYNDRTMVPVRAVSEAFDAKVIWDGKAQTVNISTSGNDTTNKTDDNIDYSKYVGVWKQFTFSNDIPETELIIKNIKDNKVEYELIFYRTAGYYNQTADINNGVINFTTIENDGSSATIEGQITLLQDKVTLKIISSNAHGLLSPQYIQFDKKDTSSTLK